MVRAACLFVVCVIAIACAAKSAPSTMETEPRQTRQGEQDPRTEIEKLSQQLEDERVRMHLGELSPQAIQPAPVDPFSRAPSSKDASCHPAQSETCSTSCTLSDSICDNAKRICELAQSMAGDAWAAGKCKRANATCTVAHDKCCGCS